MKFDKLVQSPATTAIQCTVGTEQRQFTITDAEDIPAGIRLHLHEIETDRAWTLTQQENDTYHLMAEDSDQIELLAESDIVIK